MRNLLFPCLGLLFLGLFFACGGGGGADSVKNAKDSNAARIDSLQAMGRPSDTIALSKPDADFLVNAASGAMLEVDLGRLAETHAANPRVKDFGAMMVKDHSEGLEKIKHLATRKRVILPDSVSQHQQREINNLKKKKGEDFDKAYVQMMVDDHKSDINEFQKQASQGMDSLTRVFAGSNLQVLRRHLDSANSLVSLVGLNRMPAQPILPK
jgi:putative membrane protein